MKIKIIDLLNKIFNCEKIPQKIIFDDYIWKYCNNFQDYFNVYNGYLFDVLMNDYNIRELLNVEVEIVEEPKKQIIYGGKKVKKKELEELRNNL